MGRLQIGQRAGVGASRRSCPLVMPATVGPARGAQKGVYMGHLGRVSGAGGRASLRRRAGRGRGLRTPCGGRSGRGRGSSSTPTGWARSLVAACAEEVVGGAGLKLCDVVLEIFDLFGQLGDDLAALTAVLPTTGPHACPSKTTIAEAADQLIAGMKAGIRTRSGHPYKPSVIRSYDAALRLQILPEFGARRLDSLGQHKLQDWAEQRLAAGADPITMRNHLMPLRVIYRRVVARGSVGINPTLGLELPTPQDRRERIATPAEAQALLAALDPADRALWATAMYAGLRRGDVDNSSCETQCAGCHLCPYRPNLRGGKAHRCDLSKAFCRQQRHLARSRRMPSWVRAGDGGLRKLGAPVTNVTRRRELRSHESVTAGERMRAQHRKLRRRGDVPRSTRPRRVIKPRRGQ